MQQDPRKTRLVCGLIQVFCENKLVSIPMNDNIVNSDHFLHYALQEHT